MIVSKADARDGRCLEGYIYATFAHYVRDGLIPTCFRRKTEGFYHRLMRHSVLFMHTDRYLKKAADRTTLKLLPDPDRHRRASLHGTN